MSSVGHGDRLDMVAGKPAGFPACWRCPYRRLQEAEVCVACCASRMAPALGPACGVCDQPSPSVGDGDCTNDWCRRADRWFSAVWSIGPHAGAWRWSIGAYKYRRQTEWAAVFGRVLLGYLDEHMPWFDDFDVVIPMPAFAGPAARRDWDHVGAIVAVASELAGPRWDFCYEMVVKERETPALAGLARSARRACAEGPLRRALGVPDPALVAGLRILVIDDVFTEGSTLREVARALKLAGAEEVAGLALARQPWHPPEGPPPAGAWAAGGAGAGGST